MINSKKRVCLLSLSITALLAGCSMPTEEELAEGELEDTESVEQAIGFPGDVGVIPNGTTCPAGSVLGAAYMDCEDSNGLTQQRGWHGGWSATGLTGGVELKVCRVPGANFRPVTTDPNDTSQFYAVMQLGETCPAGSASFTRRVDNEDSGNTNVLRSDLEPSTVTRSPSNSNLKFCLFRNGSTAAGFPNLGFQYGVFAGPALRGALEVGLVLSDDEDTNNNDATIADSALLRQHAETVILSGHPRVKSSTTFQMARVK
jgi:hypothetical protein